MCQIQKFINKLLFIGIQSAINIFDVGNNWYYSKSNIVLKAYLRIMVIDSSCQDYVGIEYYV